MSGMPQLERDLTEAAARYYGHKPGWRRGVGRVRPRLVLRAALAGLAAALGLVGLATLVNHDGVDRSPSASRLPAQPAVAEDLRDAFAVLRRDARPEDALPREAASRLVADGAEVGVDAALVRRVATSGDRAVYLAPGSAGACMVTARGASTQVSCDDLGPFVQRGVLLNQPLDTPRDGRRIEGVVPDGVAQVRLVYDGREQLVLADARSNGFSVEVPGDPAELVWLDANDRALRRQPLVGKPGEAPPPGRSAGPPETTFLYRGQEIPTDRAARLGLACHTRGDGARTRCYDGEREMHRAEGLESPPRPAP